MTKKATKKATEQEWVFHYELIKANLLLRRALLDVVNSHEQGDTPLAIDAAINRAADVLERGV
jgi:hypothetical protein